MFFGGKRKSKQKNKNNSNSAREIEEAGGKSASETLLDDIVSGTSSNIAKTTRMSHSHNDSAVDIIVDSDEDDIFDDEDEDDMANADGSDLPSSSLDYMLAAGANAIVAPMQKVMNAGSTDDKGTSSFDQSEASVDEDDDDTDSEDDKNGKSGHGSDSGEDYTDDEDEGEDGYRAGGYHPVKIGEVYNQR